MTSQEVRRRFLAFFKARGHAIIPSSPLVPENDPTVLFNTAGMQPLVPYLMGRPHPAGDKLADVQKCVRTGDIDDIGDNRHLTFFEMLGNWSLGSYFKEEAIKWSYELLTDKKEGFGLDPKRLYVTVFAGDENAPRDDEAARIWEKAGMPKNRIYFKDASANWWPAVKGKDTWTGPTGPCSEMFYDVTPGGLGDLDQAGYDKADDEGKVVEIWNDVFMEFEKKDGKIVGKLAKKNVDTGAGFERVCMVLQGKANVFETDIFAPLMAIASKLAGDVKRQRIISDHIRTAVFMIADGVLPANTDQGYVLRRIIRRMVFNTDAKKLDKASIETLVDSIVKNFGDFYTNIPPQRNFIVDEISKEADKFQKTIEKGTAVLNKELKAQIVAPGKPFELQHTKLVHGPDGIKMWDHMPPTALITGKWLFDFYQTFGFPMEMVLEQLKAKGHPLFAKDVEKLTNEFNSEMKKHQDLSRAGAEAKFKGGLGDTSEMSVKYHTATHLLHQALREVLGTHISQKGSNITPERLRFDFTHTAKMTDDEKKKVEDLVNSKIAAKLPVHKVELPKAEAEKTGALHFFGDKYGDMVSVYYIGNDLGSAYSKEFCGGPHVENTGTLGTFKIQKEEAVSAGVRRIKAVLS